MTDSRIDRNMNELDSHRTLVLDDEQDARLCLRYARDRWPNTTLARCYRITIPDDHILSPDSAFLGMKGH